MIRKIEKFQQIHEEEIRPKNILLFKSHFYKSSEIPILHDKNCIK